MSVIGIPSLAKPAFSRLTSAVMAIAPVIAASILGSWATLPNIPDWYAGLAKPGFTPPNWIFGPVWTALYTIMVIAFYRILRQPRGRNNRLVISAFMFQIFLNAAWSIGFFGARSPVLGAVIIIPLWISILVTMILFWQRDRFSGASFIPYLAWVSFAALLNFAIWWKNS
jgi:benzodiazapine receptor